jgi:hypothetical protein
VKTDEPVLGVMELDGTPLITHDDRLDKIERHLHRNTV